MTNIQLGNYNKLRIVKAVDFGLYLDGGDYGDILLPKRYVNANWTPGDEVTVFIYLDNEERLVATTETPLATVGTFACLEVAWVNRFGAFLNWGLMKDLFCPFREQKQRMEKGQRHVVYVTVDEESFRIVASAKVEKFLSKEVPPYRNGDAVDILVWQRTEMGYKVIVNNQYQGLVYHDKIYGKFSVGERRKAFVERLREDGKLDIALQQPGYGGVMDFADVLLAYLETHGGTCPVGDKSDADQIKALFNVSKKTFKKAVGDLYRRRIATPEEHSVKLIRIPEEE